MTIKTARDYLKKVSPWRFAICDRCGEERQVHPSSVCDSFRHDFGDEPLAGMGSIHGQWGELEDERHLRSVK